MPTKEDRHKDSRLSQHPVRGLGLEEAEEGSKSLLNIQDRTRGARSGNGQRQQRQGKETKAELDKNDHHTISQLQIALLGNCRLLGGKSCQPSQSKAVVAGSIVWEGTCITVAIQCDVTTFG